MKWWSIENIQDKIQKDKFTTKEILADLFVKYIYHGDSGKGFYIPKVNKDFYQWFNKELKKISK